MIINYDNEKLKKVVDDFVGLTGIGMSVLNHNFEYIAWNVRCEFCTLVHKTEGGLENCLRCDEELLKKCSQSRKTESHVCHAGLLETVVPIIKNDIILGYIFLGRMRCDEDFEKVFANLNTGDKEIFKNAFYELQYRDDEKIKSAASLAKILTTYILTENFMKFEYNPVIDSIVKYIEDNIDTEISVDSLCKKLYISKSMIYKNFRNAMNCTVHEFIICKRIEKAKEFLSDTGISINHVAEMVGINNYSYFSKLFKRKTGVSPLQYRKQIKRKQ